MVDVTSSESYLFSVTVIYKAAVLWICKLPPTMTWIDSQCGNQISVRAVGGVTVHWTEIASVHDMMNVLFDRK